MGKYISLAALRFTAHLTDPKKGQPTLSKTPFSVTGLTTGRQVPALATGCLTSWHDWAVAVGEQPGLVQAGGTGQ